MGSPITQAFIDDINEKFPPRTTRADAAFSETPGDYFARELEQIMQDVLKVENPPPQGLQLFPVGSGNIRRGARSYTHRIYDVTGEAVWADGKSDDIPLVETIRGEETFRIRRMWDAYAYDLDEMEAAIFMGESVDAAKADAARDVIERKHNRTLWLGDEELGLYGVLTYPYIPRHALTHTIDSNSTASEISGMLHAFCNSPARLTKKVHTPTRLLVPPEQYDYLANTYRSDNVDNTLLDMVLDKNRFIQDVVDVEELAGAGPNGEDLIMVYKANDERVLRYNAPVTFEQMSPQMTNAVTKVICHATSGGVVSRHPLACAIGVLPES